MTNATCSVCGELFDQDERKLVSCPAHSFGEVEDDENADLLK